MEEEAMIAAAAAAASQEVSVDFKTLIDSHDLDSLKQLQHLILGRLQDSNAVLSHFNDYSQQCFSEVSTDLSTNTRLLRSMKSDLDYIFLKLRIVELVMQQLFLLHLEDMEMCRVWNIKMTAFFRPASI